ncbi:MAG TPA: hypothetical protein VNE63_03480 [Candidatus Acidoferrales bacterium]|nr:hypothetical protein [Candidatus Acidoferrales bacterium]
MRKGLGTLILTGATLTLASVGPLIFPIAESGTGTLSTLALHWLIPSIAVLAIIAFVVRNTYPLITRSIAWGALSGCIATAGLEAIRIPGSHMGYMPGSMPKLMGVLLLNQFMTGPTVLSNIAGWVYHFWNGAAFGIIYVLFLGTTRRWPAWIYGLVIGIIFMLSPVVRSLGIGYFGLQFSIGFLIVVSLAHLAFGILLGWLARRFAGSQSSAFFWCFRFLFGKASREEQPAAAHP